MESSGKRIFSLVARISVGVVVCWCAGAAVPVAAAQGNQQTEIEKGRLAVGQACIQCHNLRAIQTQRKSAEKWKDTVFAMISRGGQILPEEIEPIAAYLVANFGPNSPPPAPPASAASSAQLPGGPGQQLPEAEGKSILLRSCLQCHDLQTTTAKTETQDGWSKTISRMVSYGANVTQAEQERLVEYLFGLPQPGQAR